MDQLGSKELNKESYLIALWLIQVATDSGNNNSSISPIRIILVTMASSGAIAWFFVLSGYFPHFFLQVTDNQSIVFLANVLLYGFGAFSTLIIAVISCRVDRKKLLLFSITLGTLSTGLLAFLNGEVTALILASLMGLSFGLQFPSSMALFVERTNVEGRGKYMGILVLTTFVLILFGILGISLLGLFASTAFLTILRATSYLTLVTDNCSRQKTAEQPFVTILKGRNFILYLIPWLIFCLVSGISNFINTGLPQTPAYDEAVNLGSIFMFLCVAVFSLASGFITDYYGRKAPIIIGLVSFGVSFAILMFATSPASIVIHSAIFGTAWGFCMVAFFLVPGDLAKGKSNEKYYALNAVLPFMFFSVTSSLPHSLDISAPVDILAPLFSVLVFLSVIPVIYAPETLPESVLQSKKLKNHLKKIKKLIKESNEEK